MPNTFKVSEVLTIIKKKLHLTKEQQQGIILLADGKHLMKHDELLTNIYEKYRDKQDGFLYIVFAEEQVYGAWSQMKTAAKWMSGGSYGSFYDHCFKQQQLLHQFDQLTYWTDSIII